MYSSWNEIIHVTDLHFYALPSATGFSFLGLIFQTVTNTTPFLGKLPLNEHAHNNWVMEVHLSSTKTIRKTK